MNECKTCRWRSDEFTSACTNRRSPHCADFVSGDDSCHAYDFRGYKPSFEMMGTVPFKAHCGHCERMLYSPGTVRVLDDVRDRIPTCPKCGQPVDWD